MGVPGATQALGRRAGRSSGSGSALRSILPLEVRGIFSREDGLGDHVSGQPLRGELAQLARGDRRSARGTA